jgi:hypothetical protein
MRTSSKTTELNYFKQFETEEKEEIITNETKPEQETEIKIKQRQPRLTNEQRAERRNKKNDYYKNYYEENKDKMIEKAKENSRATYGARIIRELNNNSKDISTVKEETLIKWKIKYNEKTKLYYIND